MKILVVDDDEDIRHIARLSLAKVGKMEVLLADSAQAGVRMAVDLKPDVILLDVMMPQKDGPWALNSLRQDPATAEIPVVFLTAKAMTAEVQRLRELGAEGVLTKPFDPMTLADEIREILGQSRNGSDSEASS